MNDKWNPRLWLRKWLIKPSNAEVAERKIYCSRFGSILNADARVCGVGAEMVDRRAFSGPPNAQSTVSPSPCPLERGGARPESSERPGFAGTSGHP